MTVNKHMIVWAVLWMLALFGVCIFALPFAAKIVNIGNLFGLAVSLLLLIYVWLHNSIHRWIQHLWQYRSGRIALSVIGSIVCAGVLLCLVLSVMMTAAAHRKPKEEPAVVIVLGCKVNGTEPSLMLLERMQTAYAYLEAHPHIPVIVSGGKGSDEAFSEAECMAEYLMAKGIAADRIILEDKSASTAENLQFSKNILEQKGITGDCMLVTDGFHQYRAQYLAKKEALCCYAVSADTAWYLLPTYWVREWFGILHAWVFGC